VNGVNPPNAFNILHIKFIINDLHLRIEFKMNYDNLVTNKNYPLILNTTWFRMSLVKEIMNMKKLNVTLAILVAAVMAGNSQTSVTSDVVGYSRVSVPSGTRAVVPGFVKSAVFTGVGTITSQSLSASGLAANALKPTSFTDGRPNYPTHYIEITSGAYEGYSFDVSSNSATSVSVSGLPSALNGTQVNYVIRPHLTLGDIDSSNLPDGNVVLNIFNNPSTPALTYLYDSAGAWYDGNGNYLMNHVVIYPGTGISLNNTSGSFSITFSGSVKSTKTAVPVYKNAAVNLVGPMNPSTSTTLTAWSAPLPTDTVANILSSTGNNGVSLTLLTDIGSTILYDGNGNELTSTSIEGQNALSMSAMTQDGYAVFKSPLQQ